MIKFPKLGLISKTPKTEEEMPKKIKLVNKQMSKFTGIKRSLAKNRNLFKRTKL
jgi:hypothetical protein